MLPGQTFSDAELLVLKGFLSFILTCNTMFLNTPVTNIDKDTYDKFATLIMAEAGNQDMKGKRLVADVVLNRVEDDRFPDNIEDVIFQPYQFSCINDGNFERYLGKASDECYEAIRLEYQKRLDDEIVFFSSTEYPVNGINGWKHGKHWFSY